MGCHLEPLSKEEISRYIARRLEVAGSHKDIFAEDAIELIFANSGGIPRRINQICDMSLVTGFSKRQDKINGEIVNEAVDSLGV